MNDTLLTAQCFDSLKHDIIDLEKMGIHYSFCQDSALPYLKSKNEHSSIEKEMIEYLNTHCQSILKEYQEKGLQNPSNDSIYIYRDKPFPYEKFLTAGAITLPAGIIITTLSIINLNNLKHKDYGFDILNMRKIDKTVGIVFVGLSCIVDAAGIGLTTFGIVKGVEEHKILNVIKNLQISNNKLSIIIDL